MRLLDTDTCIEILRGNVAVIARRREIADEVGTTWITAAELYYGAVRSGKVRENRRLVTEFLATLPVFGLDGGAAERFGSTKAELERAGKRLADADLFIAAVCLAKAAILVTGNLRHYARIADLQSESWMPRNRR